MEEQILNNYSTDLHALLKHTSKAIKAQQSSSKLTEEKASNLLHSIDLTISKQLETLSGMEGLINDGTKSKIKETFAAFTGTIAGAIDTQREDPISKMLRDDYTALSMIATGYTMLYTAALGAKNNDLADFTKNSLAEIAGLITKTSEVLPHIVAKELHIEDVAEEAVSNTQECWKPQNMMAEA
ncbi:MAG: hypothetical protein MK198_02215 [Gracilimonas sp.]|uniref:hypothetical protein n=1 Tax=Gracilimonas sp. TaxID=1974203 RepID=UPI0037520002|nr:hypothetical protein [Gracilimonas sp.]